jgi:hypothetical protein
MCRSTRALRALILALVQPPDGNPVLSFARDIKLLGRFRSTTIAGQLRHEQAWGMDTAPIGGRIVT